MGMKAVRGIGFEPVQFDLRGSRRIGSGLFRHDYPAADCKAMKVRFALHCLVGPVRFHATDVRSPEASFALA